MSSNLRILAVMLLIVASFVLGRLTASDSWGRNTISSDPVEAVQTALATPGSLDRAETLVETLRSVRVEDFPAVGDLYRREISNLGELEVAMLVDTWSRVDPDAAFEAVASWELQSGSKQRNGLRMVMEELAAHNPELAVERFEALSERHRGPARAQLGSGLVAGMAASDPERLRIFIQDLGADPGIALAVALGRVARHHGVETLISWSDALMGHYDDTQLRAKIFRKSVRSVARRDPRRAAAWIAERKDEDYARDGQISLAEVWIALDPAATMAWIGQSKPEEGRLRAYDAAYRRWSLRDPDAATEWIGSTERTSGHDLAVLAHAQGQLGNRDPERAMETCREILAAEMREKCHITIAKAWMKRNRAGALDWVESTGDISENARNNLRSDATSLQGRRRRGTSAKADLRQ